MNPNNSVVFLELFFKEQKLAVGSGVLYRRAERAYLITAWHNITGRHSETLKPLSRNAIFPDRVRAYVACSSVDAAGLARGDMRRAFDMPLENDEGTFYFVHPQGFPRVDVAAIPIDLSRPYPTKMMLSDGSDTIISLAMEFPATENGLGSSISCIQDFAGASTQFNVDFARYLTVSDDLFILGYPKGIIDETLQPLWKRATVATTPHLGWERQKKFLVDCASRDGMSGAPVVTYSKSGKLQVGGMTYHGTGPATLLHGIYVNRISGEAAFEAQIGTVWTSEVIDEVIDAAVQAPHSSAVEASNVEIRDLIRAEWPGDGDDDFADAVANKGRPSGYFSHQLSQTLNGRAAFDHVDALVMEEAVARATASSK